VEPLASFLTVGGRSLGLEIEVRFGSFDTMMQDTLSDLLWIDPPDVIVVAPLPSRFSPELVDSFHSLSDEQIRRSIAETEANAKSLIRAIRIQSNRPILWFGIYLMSGGLSLGLADQRLGERSQARTVAEVNKKIDDLLNEYGPGWLVDIERCKSRVGEDRFTDPIRSFTTATPFTSITFREIAVECLKYLRNITGTQKKVLALDCDNTLWGGLAGEVGYEGVYLDPQGFPSGAHLQLQRVAASLCARGVLIVLVSKKEPSKTISEKRQKMMYALNSKRKSGKRNMYHYYYQNPFSIAFRPFDLRNIPKVFNEKLFSMLISLKMFQTETLEEYLRGFSLSYQPHKV
jgi:hypothetical protein